MSRPFPNLRIQSLSLLVLHIRFTLPLLASNWVLICIIILVLKSEVSLPLMQTWKLARAGHWRIHSWVTRQIEGGMVSSSLFPFKIASLQLAHI